MGVRSSQEQESSSPKLGVLEPHKEEYKEETGPYSTVFCEGVEVRIQDARSFLLAGNAAFHGSNFEEAFSKYHRGLSILIHDDDTSVLSEIKETESETTSQEQELLTHEEVLNYVEVLLEEARNLFAEAGRPDGGLNSLVVKSSSSFRQSCGFIRFHSSSYFN